MSGAGIAFFGIMLNGLVAAFLRIHCSHRLWATAFTAVTACGLLSRIWEYF